MKVKVRERDIVEVSECVYIYGNNNNNTMSEVLNRVRRSHGTTAMNEEILQDCEYDDNKMMKKKKKIDRTTTKKKYVLLCACVCVVLMVGVLWQKESYARALDGVEAVHTEDDKNHDANVVYSLWLTPFESREKEGGGAGVVLKSAIREMATRRGTPIFPPHVTLAASFSMQTQHEAIDATRRIAALPEFANGMRCIFERRAAKQEEEDGDDSIRIEAGTSFFQSVYAVVEKTTQLIRAYDATIQLLADQGIDVYKPNPTYFPHLSLAYGDMKQSEREEIAADMRQLLADTAADTGFSFAEIQLWRTEPGDLELASWTKIHAVDLRDINDKNDEK